MKVGDLVKVQGKHGQKFVGMIIRNAGYHSFTDGGWIVQRVSDGRSTLCDKIDLELISESR
ncbi:MAG: hypothetical protein JSV97_10535 [candidate division WOR-3 bacterium]|jgi:hypothetical protein|nr:MAG: hypothetical protein JSV97_10535 [candidate division WOR-3 bacterium]